MTAQAPRPLRAIIHSPILSHSVSPGGGGVAGRRLPSSGQSPGAENPRGQLRARPGRRSGTWDPRGGRPLPQQGQEVTAAGRHVPEGPLLVPPAARAGDLGAAARAGHLLRATGVRPPPDGPRGPALTRHRPSTNTRGSRWQAMVALGRSCRSTSSISQSMKLQSPPPSSASATPGNGAKGRSVNPGRAPAASAAWAASPSRGPATPSSIPAPARPRRRRRARAPGPRSLPSADSAVNPLAVAQLGQTQPPRAAGSPLFPAAPRPAPGAELPRTERGPFKAGPRRVTVSRPAGRDGQ